MLFNSFPFLFAFLPAVLASFYLLLRLDRDPIPVLVLLSASLVFYANWRIDYLSLLLGSICWNYVVAQGIIRLRERKRHLQSRALLIVGVCGDLLVLGYFKYAAFALGMVAWFGDASWHFQKIVLPLGI